MKIVFMGTPDFAANILQKLIHKKYDIALVVSQPDRPIGRKKELFPTPVKKIALAYNIPVFQPEKIKNNHQTILEINPDIIITAAYGQMIPKTLLNAPQLGCINVHASLLPKYRGGAPIHQAIIDGEAETGVSIMYMDVTMDTGDIITQASTPIEHTDDVGTLFERLSHIGAELLTNTLPAIENGTNKRIPQKHDKATYAYNIKRENELIDWTKSAQDIFNHIRGLNPWPTAYTTINGVNAKIFKSKVLDAKQDECLKPAGTITSIHADRIEIMCGDNEMLAILDLQIAGKKRMPIKDLLNGEHPFIVGTQFSEIHVIRDD